jgi:hypothetical protein
MEQRHKTRKKRKIKQQEEEEELSDNIRDFRTEGV